MNLLERIDKALEEVRDGWCSVAKAHLLASSIVATRPEVILEIGVWGGRSLIPMALACREIGYGKVIGIDPWSAQASAQGMTGQDLKWWSEVDHEKVYQTFLANVRKLDVGDWISIRREKSDDVIPPKRIGLLSLDGNHSEQAFRDADRYSPNMLPGSLCFLDDLGWSGGFVSKAASLFIDRGFVKLMDLDTGAVFKRL